MSVFHDLTGQTFGYLTVLHRIENYKRGQARFRCRCDCGCGREDVDVLGFSLTSTKNPTRSCGSLRFERMDLNLRRPNKDGYIRVTGVGKGAPSTSLHRMIAESALGKPLPEGAVVHHVDRNRLNNNRRNLVVCPDTAYHNLIEARGRALEACGNANFRKCQHCGTYDNPANMYIKRRRGGRGLSKSGLNGENIYHRGCVTMVARVSRWKRGKAKPFGTAGLWFEMLQNANTNKPPATETDEAVALELTEKSLRAAGYVETLATGEWEWCPF